MFNVRRISSIIGRVEVVQSQPRGTQPVRLRRSLSILRKVSKILMVSTMSIAEYDPRVSRTSQPDPRTTP